MKKIIAVVLSIAIVLSLGSLAAFASGPVRVDSYEGAIDLGPWVSNDGNFGAIGERYVVINAASAFTGFGLPTYWASNGTNAPLVTMEIGFYSYSGDVATAVAGTPAHTEVLEPTGDVSTGVEFDFGTTLPAGEYVIRFKATSASGYFVLPTASTAYSSARLSYSHSAPFAFYMIFADESETYFKRLSEFADLSYEDLTKPLCKKGDSPVDLKSGTFGIRLTVPAGARLDKITGVNSPTWSNPGGGSDAEAVVYAWDTDYDTTVNGTPLASAEVTDHVDNQALVFDFDTKVEAGDYLVEISATGEKSIGFWCSGDKGAATEVYFNGTETANAPGTTYTLLITETSGEPQQPQGPVYRNASFDSFYVDGVLNFGEADGNASDKLDARGRRVGEGDGAIQELMLRGWIGFDQEIEAFGYKIGDADPVYSQDFFQATEEAVKGAGGEFAMRYCVTVPVAGIEGEQTIVMMVKLASGAEVAIDDQLEATGVATPPNTSFTFVGVPGQQPPVPTADASMIIFVVAAAAIALVVLKKKAF